MDQWTARSKRTSSPPFIEPLPHLPLMPAVGRAILNSLNGLRNDLRIDGCARSVSAGSSGATAGSERLLLLRRHLARLSRNSRWPNDG